MIRRCTEFQVQLPHTAQHEGRQVLVAAGAFGAVDGSRQGGCRWCGRAAARCTTRASARASGAPGQVWTPRPNAMWWRALARATSKTAGSSKWRGSRLAAPFISMNVDAGRHVDPADRDRDPREPEVALDGALDAQRLLDEVRDAVTLAAQQAPAVRGCSASTCQRRAEQPDGGLLAGREDVGRDPHDVDRPPAASRPGTSPRPARPARRDAARGADPRCRR